MNIDSRSGIGIPFYQHIFFNPVIKPYLARVNNKKLNFLAHLFLSCNNENDLVGNFVADFFKSKDLHLVPSRYKSGDFLHRKIDFYTDNHPEVKKCTLLLHPTQGKYAPVIIDIFFDYLLYQNWDKYTAIAFDDFQTSVYGVLNRHKSQFTGRFPALVTSMIEDRFLEKYTTIDGLKSTFKRMEGRLSFPSNIRKATVDLQAHYDKFNEFFNVFFPDVIREVEKSCNL